MARTPISVSLSQPGLFLFHLVAFKLQDPSEPNGISGLVSDIHLCEPSMGVGEKRVNEEEIPVMKKLRRVGAAVQQCLVLPKASKNRGGLCVRAFAWEVLKVPFSEAV